MRRRKVRYYHQALRYRTQGRRQAILDVCRDRVSVLNARRQYDQILNARPVLLERFRCGLRSRTAISQVVYAKALALSHEGRQEFGIGAMVSYMQIDAQKIADAIPYMHLYGRGQCS